MQLTVGRSQRLQSGIIQVQKSHIPRGCSRCGDAASSGSRPNPQMTVSETHEGTLSRATMLPEQVIHGVIRLHCGEGYQSRKVRVDVPSHLVVCNITFEGVTPTIDFVQIGIRKITVEGPKGKTFGENRSLKGRLWINHGHIEILRQINATLAHNRLHLFASIALIPSRSKGVIHFGNQRFRFCPDRYGIALLPQIMHPRRTFPIKHLHVKITQGDPV